MSKLKFTVRSLWAVLALQVAVTVGLVFQHDIWPPYRNVEILDVRMVNNRVLLETSFEKLRCDLERFIPRGVDETGFHTQPLDYFEIIGSQHGENREAGYHSSRVMIDLPEQDISLIEIRTLHACPTTENASRRVTKVFAVIDLNELRALE